MLHLGGRISLRVNVRNLFELERAFEGNREIHPPAQIQDVARMSVLFRQPLDVRCPIEDLPNLGRKGMQRVNELAALEHAHVFESGQPERNHS